MSEDQEPNWHLLPHRPREFFGLEAGFDRDGLRRAYGRLIRRFKPERHPEEFQKIRAAYEALRRGSPPRLGVPWPATWSTENLPWADPDDDDLHADDALPVDTPTSALMALRGEGPAEVFTRLRSATEKTAQQYLELALLSDVVENGGECTNWLRQGLCAWPRDLSLWRMLGAAVDDVAPGEIADFLVEIGKQAPDAVWDCAEPLWMRLARHAPFPTYRDTFERCGALGEEAPGSRVLATLRQLRPVLFAADEEWLQTQWAYLMEYGSLLPPFLVEDLDRLEMLYEYRRRRREFLDGSALRERTDRLLQEICRGDPDSARDTMAIWRAEVVNDKAAVLRALPFDAADLSFACMAVAVCASWSGPDGQDQDDWDRGLSEHVRVRLLALGRSPWTRAANLAILGLVFLVIPGVVIALAFLAAVLAESLAEANVAFWGVQLGLPLLAVFPYCEYVLKRFWPALNRRQVRAWYGRTIRGQLADILADLGVGRLRLLDWLDRARGLDPWVRSNVRTFAEGDWGLTLIALAARG